MALKTLNFLNIIFLLFSSVLYIQNSSASVFLNHLNTVNREDYNKLDTVEKFMVRSEVKKRAEWEADKISTHATHAQVSYSDQQKIKATAIADWEKTCENTELPRTSIWQVLPFLLDAFNEACFVEIASINIRKRQETMKSSPQYSDEEDIENRDSEGKEYQISSKQKQGISSSSGTSGNSKDQSFDSGSKKHSQSFVKKTSSSMRPVTDLDNYSEISRVAKQVSNCRSCAGTGRYQRWPDGISRELFRPPNMPCNVCGVFDMRIREWKEVKDILARKSNLLDDCLEDDSDEEHDSNEETAHLEAQFEILRARN